MIYFKKILKIFHKYPQVNLVKNLINRLPKNISTIKNKNTSHVAIQCVPDQTYYGLMLAIITDLRLKHGIHSKLVVTQSVNGAFGFSILSEIKRSGILQAIKLQQWIRSFKNTHIGVAYRSFSWSHPIMDTIFLYRSYKIWLSWKLLDEFSNFSQLKIDGIQCGDLITDTYLSFKPSPCFNVKDIFVWRLIWQSLRDIHRSKKYFKTQLPMAYLTTYSSYIVHGIPVRVAVSENIPVYSFGDLGKFAVPITKNHLFHTSDASRYLKIFNSLEDKKKTLALKKAEELLNYRISGGIDPATSYMIKSAYSENININQDLKVRLKNKPVVFLHDFYDSPHIFDDFIFNDFWEWITFTIEKLNELGIEFFIKPHPNQISLSDSAIVSLKSKYRNINWLDIQTNNKFLSEADISCGITVYGTISHELAFMGIPSIGAARHPHHSFNFCRTAKSREEYTKLLETHELMPIDKEDMREQALKFYSIHNELHDKNQADLSSKFAKYWSISRSISVADTNDMILSLDELRKCKGYNNFIKLLSMSN